ncbi:hypothetical protein GS597_16380 [Synechococcales cyanobacterium C]|uniref:Alpha-L-glutamate ligase-related protein ATP-grasp domain-containing protein n=1 Tax=Petrachloros mirabilis ULC683 TaxID=2781853 RepID=A0A8K2A1I4_9CYAN|nr:hypothetical protein [Petrachloros mirabilis ULC683]
MRRIIRGLYRELWQNSLPHSLISVRYLLPGQDQRVRLHRQLWWQSRPNWPRFVWLLIEFWVWLRWISFSGWRVSWRVLRRRGPDVQVQEGISLWQQGQKLIHLSIGCCVPPREVYRFRLYLEPERIWDLVFDHEINAYHRWRSQPLGLGDVSRALLADKLRQTEVLSGIGIPMAPILACLSRGQAADLSTWLTEGTRLFCKTRSGNCGIGAFTVWQHNGLIQGQRFSGERLPDTKAVSRAWRELLARDAALVQPCLLNHPWLAPLAVGDAAITIRYISCQDREQTCCLSATLEIPAGQDVQSGQMLYVILPIEPESGQIHPFPDALLPSSDAQRRQAGVMTRLPSESMVPDWPILVEASLQAQRRFPDLWAIAWDWVVTPQGPRLLEGNSGWSGAIPQLLYGGFLQGNILR